MRVVSKRSAIKLPQPHRSFPPFPSPFFTVESPIIYNVGRDDCHNIKEENRMSNAPATSVPITLLRLLLISMLFIFCIVVYTGFNDTDLRYRRLLHSFAYIETGMRRLIIRYILPYNTKPVLRVLH